MATTIPGGRYRRVDGTLVNAHGEALGEPKHAPPQERKPEPVEKPVRKRVKRK